MEAYSGYRKYSDFATSHDLFCLVPDAMKQGNPLVELKSCVSVSVSERMCVCVDLSYGLSARLPFSCVHPYHISCV